MSDLFSGVGAGIAKVLPHFHHAGDGCSGGDGAIVKEIKFEPFNRVSMYTFFEVLGWQLVRSVRGNASALVSATSEVFSGIGVLVGKEVHAAATKCQALFRGKKARRLSDSEKSIMAQRPPQHGRRETLHEHFAHRNDVMTANTALMHHLPR